MWTDTVACFSIWYCYVLNPPHSMGDLGLTLRSGIINAICVVLKNAIKAWNEAQKSSRRLKKVWKWTAMAFGPYRELINIACRPYPICNWPFCFHRITNCDGSSDPEEALTYINEYVPGIRQKMAPKRRLLKQFRSVFMPQVTKKSVYFTNFSKGLIRGWIKRCIRRHARSNRRLSNKII